MAGREADRRGPGPPFAVGCTLFALGLIGAGLAPTMPLLVVARVVQGLGAGTVPAVAYACIGRSYPPSARPRMFAVLSTAWVVPALVGPALAGLVAWARLALGVPGPPAARRDRRGDDAARAVPDRPRAPARPGRGSLAISGGRPPERRCVGPSGGPGGERARRPRRAKTSDAVLVAVGAGLVIGGLTASDIPWLMPVLIAAGILLGLPPFIRLVPTGTLRARAGLPADVLARGVLTFAFFGTDAFVPLAIQNVRHESVTYTGFVLTASTLSWTAFAWVQQHYVHRLGPRFFVRLGFCCIAVGIVGVAASLSSSVPVWTVVVSWSIGAAGMGFAYVPLSLVMLDAAEPGREGAASAALQLSDQLGFALGTGVVGAAVALGEVLSWFESTSLLLGAGITGTVAVAGIVLAGRLPTRLAGSGRSQSA